MANKEYIEREKLKQAFSADTQGIRGWDVDLFDLLMTEIDEVPAADVVPVVRCGNCKHYELKGGSFWCVLHMVRMHSDDFCSYGKRKEGKQ